MASIGALLRIYKFLCEFSASEINFNWWIMAKKKSDDQVDSVDEPNFEDPEDFVDDVSDQGEPMHLENGIAMMKSEKCVRSRKICMRIALNKCQHGYFKPWYTCTVL